VTVASINIRVPVAKIIASLEAKVKEFKDIPKKQKAHEKAMVEWRKQVTTLISDNADASEVATHSDCYGVPRGQIKVELTFFLKKSAVPEQPKPDFEYPRFGNPDSQITEIENALRMLKMTDEDYVNASTFKSISRFL
jgi:hypothetical protein